MTLTELKEKALEIQNETTQYANTADRVGSVLVRIVEELLTEIVTEKIADGAITTAKLADDAVTAAKIASGAVTTDGIASGAITSSKIASNNITTGKLDGKCVTLAKLADEVTKLIGQAIYKMALITVEAGREGSLGDNTTYTTIKGISLYANSANSALELPHASANTDGLMSYETYQTLQTLVSDVATLKKTAISGTIQAGSSSSTITDAQQETVTEKTTT